MAKDVVARDGIESPTQTFSGLWLLGPVYIARETIYKTNQYNQSYFLWDIESQTGIQIKVLV